MNITGVVERLMVSYRKTNEEQRLCAPCLPSMESIAAINEALKSIIFPGSDSENQMHSATLSQCLSKRIRGIAAQLSVEIERSLAHCEEGSKDNRVEAERHTIEALGQLPRIRDRVRRDVEAIYLGDPAAKSRNEVVLAYPGLEAIMIHRVAHELWIRDIPLVPRMMSEHVHGKTGVDIHPNARIGDYFFIDHATGVVIGETTVIGNNVKVYQGVTIGAISVKKSEADIKRHPTIEDNVTIYAGATILGGKTVIGHDTTIGGNVWITSSVPPYSKIYNRQ